METSGYAVPATTWGGPVPTVWNAGRRSRFGDVALVLFLLAQCFDGILTYVGVTTFGVGIEANPLLSSLMARFGEGTALLGAKVVAGGLGIALHLRQVHTPVALLTLFYVVVAIVPWIAILFL